MMLMKSMEMLMLLLLLLLLLLLSLSMMTVCLVLNEYEVMGVLEMMLVKEEHLWWYVLHWHGQMT
jgi:hypothetical protein